MTGLPDDGVVTAPDVAVFGERVAQSMTRVLGEDLVGVYFVGSVALGGYVQGESDVDITAVSKAWARIRWPDPAVIDAAVALRRGNIATLHESAVDALLSTVMAQLVEARRVWTKNAP